MFVKSFFFPGAVAAALLCSGSAQAGNESRYQAYPLDNKSAITSNDLLSKG